MFQFYRRLPCGEDFFKSLIWPPTKKRKCGANFVYLYEGCGKTQVTINDTIPHT